MYIEKRKIDFDKITKHLKLGFIAKLGIAAEREENTLLRAVSGNMTENILLINQE